METLQNLPWYTYVILGAAILAYAYRFFWKPATEPDKKDPKFLTSAENALSGEQLFSISLDAVTSEWWEVNTNTLAFKSDKKFNKVHFNNYLKGWGIDTKEGYWGLTNYFMEDGRRWYFDFIYPMIQTEPKENWDKMMSEKFGSNERAERYLKLLSSGKTLNTLKSKGFITFDSEIEKGVAAYDSSVLVGHARRAYTAGIITEEEAWQVINFATQLARDNFSSWEEYGKSYVLGFALDIRDRNDGFKEEMYHLYQQVTTKSQSPWNQIPW